MKKLTLVAKKSRRKSYIDEKNHSGSKYHEYYVETCHVGRK